MLSHTAVRGMCSRVMKQSVRRPWGIKRTIRRMGWNVRECVSEKQKRTERDQLEDPVVIQHMEAGEVTGGAQILGSYFQGGGYQIS